MLIAYLNVTANFSAGEIAFRRCVSIFKSFSPKYVDSSSSNAETLIRKKLKNFSGSLLSPSKSKVNAPSDGRELTKG